MFTASCDCASLFQTNSWWIVLVRCGQMFFWSGKILSANIGRIDFETIFSQRFLVDFDRELQRNDNKH